MVAIGLLLLIGAYGGSLSGYSLIRGYCNNLGALWNPVHPAVWSTQVYTGTAIIPPVGGCSANPASQLAQTVANVGAVLQNSPITQGQ